MSLHTDSSNGNNDMHDDTNEKICPKCRSPIGTIHRFGEYRITFKGERSKDTEYYTCNTSAIVAHIYFTEFDSKGFRNITLERRDKKNDFWYPISD